MSIGRLISISAIAMNVLRYMEARNRLGTAGTILDIGANMGVIAIGFLKNGWMSRAIAIEPAPDNFALLQHNVRQNKLEDRMVCLQYAASDLERTVQLELNSQNLGGHRVRVRSNSKAPGLDIDSPANVISVPSKPLDDIIAELPRPFLDNISLIWMDTEGHEGRIFAGGRELFKRDIPTVAEIFPRLIVRSGISKEEFQSLLERYWSRYWVIRRGRHFAYPISAFGTYWDELGTDGDFDNVIFSR